MAAESLLLRGFRSRRSCRDLRCPRRKHSVYTKYVDNGPKLQHSCYKAQNVRHTSAQPIDPRASARALPIPIIPATQAFLRWQRFFSPAGFHA